MFNKLLFPSHLVGMLEFSSHGVHRAIVTPSSVFPSNILGFDLSSYPRLK